MDFKTPLAKVKNLSSANNASSHWWMQRITALALIPLSIWMVIYLKLLLVADYSQIIAWLNEPWNTLLALTWIVMVFYHSALGLQVVIEDYVSTETYKITAIWTVKASCFILALASIIAIFRIMILG